MTPIIISIIGLLISGTSVICALYFSHKTSKTTDLKELEQRVAERTETNLKLDEINRNTTEIRYDVTSLRKDVQKHGEKIIELEASNKSAQHRLDTMERLIGGGKGD